MFNGYFPGYFKITLLYNSSIAKMTASNSLTIERETDVADQSLLIALLDIPVYSKLIVVSEDTVAI